MQKKRYAVSLAALWLRDCGGGQTKRRRETRRGWLFPGNAGLAG